MQRNHYLNSFFQWADFPFILLLLFFNPLQGQAKYKQSPKEPLSMVKEDGHHFLLNAGAVATAPLYWEKADFLRTGIYTGLTLLAMTFDKPAKKTILNMHSAIADDFFMVDAYYGSGKMLLLSGAMYGGGFLFKNKKIRRMGLLSFEAFLFSGITANMIKPVIGRMRPDVSESNLNFSMFSLNDDYHALPSGHTTVAFAFSTVMAKSIDHPVWDVFWYGLATSTALARIYHNRHWTSDVIGAGLLGYWIGSYLYGRENDFVKEDKTLNFYLLPNKIGLIYYFK